MGHIGTNGIDKIPQKVTQAANNPPGQRPEEDSGKDNRQGPKANPDPSTPPIGILILSRRVKTMLRAIKKDKITSLRVEIFKLSTSFSLKCGSFLHTKEKVSVYITLWWQRTRKPYRSLLQGISS